MSSTKSLVAIADVYVPFEPETKAMRGFAFVTFTDSRDAFAAVDAMDGHAALSSILTFSTATAYVKTLLFAHTLASCGIRLSLGFGVPRRKEVFGSEITVNIARARPADIEKLNNPGKHTPAVLQRL